MHIIRNRIRSQHARTLDSFLIQFQYYTIGWYHLQARIFRVANPVLQNILQLVRIVSELFLGVLRILLVILNYCRHSLRTYSYSFVMSLYVVNTVPVDRHRRRIVSRTTHLIDIPIGLQIAQVTYTYIGTEVFCFLIIPQWECIVIAISKDDRSTFFLQRIQIILSEVAASITSAAVVVIPSLANHLYRNQQTCYTGNYSCRSFFLHLLGKPLRDSRYT